MAYAGEIRPTLREGGGEQSLLSTMNRFVQAVRVMDETIMIPNRLKDITPGTNGSIGACSSAAAAAAAASSSAAASSDVTSAPAGTSLVAAGDMDAKANTNLYAFYKMLHAVQTELVRGHEGSDDTEGSQDSMDESSRQVAAAFRHHLQGLFGLLKQLTDAAQHVTSRYQEEVGDIASSKLAPFTL